MYFKLTETDLNEILYEGSLFIDSKYEHGINEEILHLDDKYFNGSTSTQIWFDGVAIGYGSMFIHQDTRVTVESDAPVLSMVFNLRGSRITHIQKDRKKVEFQTREHNLLYTPSSSGTYEIPKQKERNEVFRIILTENYFKRLAMQDSPLLSRMCDMIEYKKMNFLGDHNLSITPQMQLIIQDMISCNKFGALKRLYLESKVIELLMLQVEQFEQTTQLKPSNVVKAYDHEKILSAKSIVEENLDTPFTLFELAHQVGLNDFKLKKGFKALFGTTVFGYLHELRMHKAKSLLFDTQHTILEISEAVGYKNPQHFSAAFKKRFGMQPSLLRKKEE